MKMNIWHISNIPTEALNKDETVSPKALNVFQKIESWETHNRLHIYKELTGFP